ACSVLRGLERTRVCNGASVRVVGTCRLRLLPGTFAALAATVGAPVIGKLRAHEDELPAAQGEPGTGTQDLGVVVDCAGPRGARAHVVLAGAHHAQPVLVLRCVVDASVNWIGSRQPQRGVGG